MGKARVRKEIKRVPLSVREVTLFRIANRRGYAALARRHLTEGRTPYQAYSRLVKACRRNGFELPMQTTPELARMM